MFNPNERINDGPPAKTKPKMVVGISFNPKERINDESPSESDEKDPNQIMDEACVGICRTLNVSSGAAPRLRQYLEAFVNAAASMPSRGEDEQEDNEQEGME